MRVELLTAVVVLAIGCASSKWTRTTVDDTGMSGAHVSMHLHVDGSQKTLTIVHADLESGDVRVARRTGTGAGWGAFTTSVLESDKGRLPASAMGSDGTVWVAYLRGGPTPIRGELVVAHRGPTSNQWVEESFGLTVMTERPAIAYVTDDEDGDRIHLVHVLSPYHYLRHHFRDASDSTWTLHELFVPSDEVEDLDDDDPRGRGTQVSLYADGRRLRLFYREGPYAGVFTPDRLVLHDPRPSAFFPYGSKIEVVPTPTEWTNGPDSRYHVGPVPTHRDCDAHDTSAAAHRPVGVSLANCGYGELKYRVQRHSFAGGPIPSWSVRTPWGGDPSMTRYCASSFAHDAADALYLTYYRMEGLLQVFIRDPHDKEWRSEIVDSGPNDRGRYNATVYDPLAQEILVAYHDATDGALRLATRPAN